MKKIAVSVLKLLFFLSIGALFIWLFVKDLTPEDKTRIFESLEKAKYGWIILAIAFALISHVLRTLRWMMLIKPMGYNPGFWNVCMSLMIGYFANLALPRLGEVTRCTILAKYEKIPFQKSFGTVVAERAFDLLSFILLFFINLFIQYHQIHQYVSTRIYIPLKEKFIFIGKGYIIYFVIIFCLVLLTLFFIFRKKLRKYRLYQRIARVFAGFAEGIKSLVKIQSPVKFLVYTVIIWCMYFLMTYICFFSIKEVSSVGPHAGFSVLILGTIGIMVVQGGIGIYPTIVAETLVSYEGEKISPYAYALGWLIWLSQTVSLIVAGVISLILLPVINREKNGKAGNSETKDT